MAHRYVDVGFRVYYDDTRGSHFHAGFHNNTVLQLYNSRPILTSKNHTLLRINVQNGSGVTSKLTT